MITPMLHLLTQAPDVHYKGGASGLTVSQVDATAKLFRFLFSTVPQWVQLAGILIGGPLAVMAVWQCWKYRAQISAWFRAQSRVYKLALVGSIALVGLAAGGTGLVGYSYMMTNNDFCQSCHIMDTAWNRFQVSAHKDLQCHACHRQSIFVSSVELYWWVTERRMAVPAHDKVPNTVCAECHLRSSTDSTRTNVLRSAGHVVHLKSDSSALRNVQCVTCHGRDFHLFRPNNSTCMQSGCHVNKRIKLGVMANQNFMHCTVCHAFRGKVSDTATVGVGRTRLSPNATQCTACHAMSDKFFKYDFLRDPHNGGCGTCHNPHKQVAPGDAYQSCATAQCHAAADTLTAFHRGLGTHTLDDCGTCHKPHTWKVKGSDCLACHKTIYQDRPTLRQPPKRSGASATAAEAMSRAGPPAGAVRRSPHRLTAAKKARWLRVASWHRAARGTAGRGGLPAAAPGGRPAAATAPVTVDTSAFPHARHKSLPCSACHGDRDTHGQLKFGAPDGCRSCHHGTAQKAPCATCHAATPTPRDVSVTFNVVARTSAPVTRVLHFRHEQHGTLACARCHTADANRTVSKSCLSCHVDHHAAARHCTSCHANARTGHDRSAHDGCATCHGGGRTPALTYTRALCLTCHEKQLSHEPGGDCAACHAIASHSAARGRT